MNPEIDTVWLHTKENYEVRVIGYDEGYFPRSVIVTNNQNNFFICFAPILFENGTFNFVRKENK